MLFVINKSLINALKKDLNNAEINSFLEMLALSRRKGKHLIFSDRTTLVFLSNHEGISPLAKSIYRKIYSQIAEGKAYYDKLTWHVEIVGNENVFKYLEVGRKKVIRLSIEYIDKLAIDNETILLTENQSDIVLYEAIFYIYLYWSKIGNTLMKYEPRGGGGNTTSVEYKSIQTNKSKLCLCILDGDLKYQDANIGETARQVERIDDKDQPLCLFNVLPLHEIENIVPSSVYKEVIGKDSTRVKCLDFIIRLEKSKIANSRRFFDVKKGIRLFDIISKSKESPYRKFWESVLVEVCGDLTCKGDSLCTKREDCSCEISAGMGPKILEGVNQYILSKRHQDVALMVDKSLKDDWTNLGELLVSWCCGASIMSAL